MIQVDAVVVAMMSQSCVENGEQPLLELDRAGNMDKFAQALRLFGVDKAPVGQLDTVKDFMEAPWLKMSIPQPRLCLR